MGNYRKGAKGYKIVPGRVDVKRLFSLYIDESGDHTYHKVDDVSKRYLGLTGCIIDAEYYRKTFQPLLEKLKQDHFPHSPDDPVILHRKDIINKHGAFWRLREHEKENAFNRDLLDFLKKQSYRIITVVIDKEVHRQRYGVAAFHPYNYCLAAMLERYCGLLRFFGARGDVMGESRGGREDKQLKEAYRRFYGSGTYYWLPEHFQSVLTSKEIKLKRKEANIAGLQLADILAYSLKQEVLAEKRRDITPKGFNKEICDAIQGKYNRHFNSGRVDGYGKIFLG